MADKNLKYAMVYSWYYDEGESCEIFPAGDFEREHNGENWLGSRDEFNLYCTDTLRDAITSSGYWAPYISFSGEFSDEEYKEIATIINELVHDEDYCGKFTKHDEVGTVYDHEFTDKDIKILNENRVTFEIDPNQLRVYVDGKIVEQVEGDTSDYTEDDFRGMRRHYSTWQFDEEDDIPEPVDEPESGDDGLDKQYDE